jgi:hypothetical protein
VRTKPRHKGAEVFASPEKERRNKNVVDNADFVRNPFGFMRTFSNALLPTAGFAD